MSTAAPVEATSHPDNPLTIAFTIEELTVGGAERMVLAMANEFARQGWQVHMVCLRQAGILADELDARIELHVLDKKPGLDVSLVGKLRRCIRQINPMAVNSHLWVGNTWTRIALFFSATPVVATEHSRDDWKPAYYRWIDRLLSRRTAALVCVSSDTAEFYRNTIGLADSLVSVINNGVDTALYANGNGGALRSQWLHDTLGQSDATVNAPVVIGTVGRIVSAKNHRRMMDALSMLVNDAALADHSLCLVVVGDGEDRPVIEQYVLDKSLQNHVVFTGSRHDIPDVLAAFDIFVLSSDREGHPLTALEAQAAGAPVVLTNAGGSREAVARRGDAVGGVLVDKSAEALAEAMRDMILDPALRQSRANFAREYALAHFDKARMIERYAELFQSFGRQD